MAADGRPTATALMAAATTCGADLIVMGSCRHRWAREVIFGSCTQAMLRDAALPVLLMQ